MHSHHVLCCRNVYVAQMPWLVRPETVEDPLESLLFIHVPRCGGTSLTKHFDVVRHARKQ